MDSTPERETKRRVVVGAIELCLSRSNVKNVVEPGTVQIYFESHPDEVWGESEVRLKPVWDVLVGQPGLSAKEVGPPFLVLKSYEQTLGMFVALPPDLENVPSSEVERLRGSLALDERGFSDALQKIGADISADLSSAPPKPGVVAAPPRAATSSSGKQTNPKQVVIALALGAMAATAIFLSVRFAFRQTDTAFSVADVAHLVQLKDARRDESSLVATVADPKWEALDASHQKELAEALFEIENQKGVKAITITDGAGRIRIRGMDLDGLRQVTVH